MQRMSAADYRKLHVEPALREEGADREFLKKVAQAKSKPSRVKKNDLTARQRGEAESQIQSRILERLGMVKDGFFWRENSGVSTETDKYGKKRMWRAGIKGICDIVGVYKGKFVGIEVKAKGKKASLDQQIFMNRVRECGGVAFVCDDDKEVLRMLEEAMVE